MHLGRRKSYFFWIFLSEEVFSGAVNVLTIIGEVISLIQQVLFFSLILYITFGTIFFGNIHPLQLSSLLFRNCFQTVLMNIQIHVDIINWRGAN